MKKLFISPAPIFLCLNIAYRISCCEKDEVTLAVDFEVFKKRDCIKYLERMKDKKIFDEVVYCNLFLDRACLPKKRDEVVRHVIKSYDNHFEDINFNLTDFDEIVVFNDAWCSDINLYLNYKEVHYQWIEIETNHLMLGAANNYPPLLKEEFNRLSAESALAPFAYPVLFKESGSSIDFLQKKLKKYTLWSLPESIKSISNDRLNNIMDCYQSRKEFGENISIFLANSYGYSINLSDIGYISHYGQSIMGYLEYERDEFFSIMYRFLLDVYMPDGKVYVKFHPNDPMFEKRKLELYPSNVMLFPEAPFQYINEYFSRNNIKVKELLAMGSTSVKDLDDAIYNHKTILGLDYFKTMHCYSSLYVLKFLLDYLSITKVAASETVVHQLENLSNGQLECIKIKGYEDLKDVEKYRGTFVILDAIHHDFDEDKIRIAGENMFICFINIGLSKLFKPSKMFLRFIPIEITKDSINIDMESSLNYREFLWIYSKNVSVRRRIRKFYFEKEMKFSNMKLCTKRHTLQEELELAEKIIEKNTYEKGINICQSFSVTEKAFWNFAIEECSTTRISAILHQCSDIEEYLMILSVLKRKYMVICAVRDTPGSAINKELLELIHSVGYKNFSTELWRMYVGILWKDEAVVDMVGTEREAPIDIHCKYSADGTDIHIVSKAWKKGNVASICIAGRECAANIRGMNIVVYDPRSKVVLDSVGFDGHEKSYRFIRK